LKAGEPYCENTPYEEFHEITAENDAAKKKYRKMLLKLAQDELAFLKSLRGKEKDDRG
jgi:hypothetical protein